jgi:hypothetical protein
VNQAASTVTAYWPHFSNVLVGGLKSAADWWVDHVATYALGPKKKPDCNKPDQGWKTDAGWTFTGTNATGGKMKVPPLDGCAAATGTDGRHGAEITNRYWYAFRAPLPPGVDQGLPQVLQYSSPEDTLTGLYLRLARGEVVIPGHSRAQVSIANHPEGHTTVWTARADPISMGLNAVLSLADVGTLGLGKLDRAALKAGEDALWDLRAKDDTIGNADIAATTADPGWQKKTIDEARSTKKFPVSHLESFLNGVSMLDCAEQVAAQVWPPSDDTSLKKMGTFLSAVASQCRVQFAEWALGKIYSDALPANQARLALGAVKGLLDFKPEQATLETSLAGWAKVIGSADYLHARLSGQQATDPRSESQFSAGALPDTELRPNGPHTCPTPGPVVIPGAAPGVRCRWVTHLDLDGNGTDDEVVLWRTDHARGAVAVTDTGAILQLQPTPVRKVNENPTADWRTTGLDPVDQFPGSLDSATPMKVIHTSSGREVLAIDSYDGALNSLVWLLGMDTAGHLAFVADSKDPTAAYTQAGLNHQGGCPIDQVVFTPPMHLPCEP